MERKSPESPREGNTVFWNIVTRSSYTREKLDGKFVDRAKRNKNTHSRIDLLRTFTAETKHTTLNSPKHYLKKDYVKAIVLLRGIQRIEYLCGKRQYNLTNTSCPICKEKLIQPIFRHMIKGDPRHLGYHVSCIDQWIRTSLTFVDPITKEIYTESEIARLSLNCAFYGIGDVEFSLIDMKRDEANLAIDRIERHEIQERMELLCDSIRQSVDRITNAHALGRRATGVRGYFRHLARLNVDVAQELAGELIQENVDSSFEGLLMLLFEITSHIEDWSNEEEVDIDDEDFELDLHEASGQMADMLLRRWFEDVTQEEHISEFIHRRIRPIISQPPRVVYLRR